MDLEHLTDESALRKTVRAFYDTPVGSGIFNIAGTVQIVASILGALAVLYLGMAVFTGEIGRVGASPAAAERFRWVGMAFLYSVIALSLSLVIRNFSDDSLIVILGIAGAAIYIGLPMALTFGVAQGTPAAGPAGSAPTLHQGNAAAQVLTGQFMFLGFFLWSLTALRVCVFAADRIISGINDDDLPVSNRDFIAKQASRPIKTNIATRSGPFARCWEQPHCIDFIKEVCRPWAERRTCWRLQTGCMCDVRYLYDAMRRDNTMGQRADAGLEDMIPNAGAMGGGQFERKLYCKDCRIYLEHQRRKFRVLSPLSVPITAVIMLAASPIVLALYQVLVNWSAAAIRIMWLSDSRGDVAQRFQNDLGNTTAAYAALALCGVFLLSAVMRFIEWLTLELKV